MDKKMGYILILVGIVFLLFGVFVIVKSNKRRNKNDTNELPNKPKQENNSKDEIAENKAKGDSFEKFVVKQFDKRYFTLNEWRSDKYVEGIYAVSNHFPDLEIEFNLKTKEVSDKFAIECKWRKNYYQGGIEWANDYQIDNYKKYAETLKIPVFVVIGVGGEPENPNELFIIPLGQVTSNILSKETLLKYKKISSDKGFFWDFENKELK